MFNLFLSIMGLFGTIILGILQLLAVIVFITTIASGFALLGAKSESAYIKALVRKHGGK